MPQRYVQVGQHSGMPRVKLPEPEVLRDEESPLTEEIGESIGLPEIANATDSGRYPRATRRRRKRGRARVKVRKPQPKVAPELPGIIETILRNFAPVGKNRKGHAGQQEKALRRRRAKGKVAKASRKVNR